MGKSHPENSFLRKFLPVGIIFYYMSSIILSSIITEKYNIKDTSLRSSYNENKINLFPFKDVEHHRKLKTERISLHLLTIPIFLIRGMLRPFIKILIGEG